VLHLAAGSRFSAGYRVSVPLNGQENKRRSPDVTSADNITNDMSPGELLREARRRHGLTQAQLAARARTSQAAISRIERDLVSPSVATLASLLDLVNEELVLEAREVDWGHDKTLLEDNLRRTTDERFRRGVSFSRWVERNRGTAQRR
jgi:transcriptional regulator with XRE-family HTH domain